MNDLTSYRVKVISPGHTIFFRNRKVRTPATFNDVHKNELKLLESSLKSLSLNYSVRENKNDKVDEENIVLSDIEPINDDVKIEELYPIKEKGKKEPESILDKLISENG